MCIVGGACRSEHLVAYKQYHFMLHNRVCSDGWLLVYRSVHSKDCSSDSTSDYVVLLHIVIVDQHIQKNCTLVLQRCVLVSNLLADMHKSTLCIILLVKVCTDLLRL